MEKISARGAKAVIEILNRLEKGERLNRDEMDPVVYSFLKEKSVCKFLTRGDVYYYNERKANEAYRMLIDKIEEHEDKVRREKRKEGNETESIKINREMLSLAKWTLIVGICSLIVSFLSLKLIL